MWNTDTHYHTENSSLLLYHVYKLDLVCFYKCHKHKGGTSFLFNAKKTILAKRNRKKNNHMRCKILPDSSKG